MRKRRGREVLDGEDLGVLDEGQQLGARHRHTERIDVVVQERPRTVQGQRLDTVDVSPLFDALNVHAGTVCLGPVWCPYHPQLAASLADWK